MFITLALLAVATPIENLDFSTGKLTHWRNDGFRLVGPQVTSADRGTKGGTARLQRTIRIPEGSSQIRFAAAAFRTLNATTAGNLEVILETGDRQRLPRLILRGEVWKDAPELLAAADGRLRWYAYDVSGHVGKTLRLAIVDEDSRPGCHVISTGFELLTRDEVNSRAFATAMRRLQSNKALPRVFRYDSRHFLALSNAAEEDTEYRLYNCETMYTAFIKHFRGKGFVVRVPTEKLMVAIFGTQQGFEAYLGQRLPSTVTGLFHTPTNRLVVYDVGTNRAFVEGKKALEQTARMGNSDLERQRRLVTFSRWVRERRDDLNLTTMMHEVAHQMSFNCGLLNRSGDVPVWLAEGLATYCEPTSQGHWQGIGGANSQRCGQLARALKEKRTLIALRDLIRDDDWLRKAKDSQTVLLGYAQSWALFRMLMEQRPKALRAYLKMIHARRSGEHRLPDFATNFGRDLTDLERRYHAYMRGIVKTEHE